MGRRDPPPLLPLAWALCLVSLSWSRPEAPLPAFTDVTVSAGIRFRHVSGSPEKDYIFEAKGGGAGLFDYDLDGLLDIFLINGSTLPDLQNGVVHPNANYHNNGDGTFTDVAARAGVQGRGWAMGCTSGDYDNDGRPDLYVLCLSGKGQNFTKVPANRIITIDEEQGILPAK